MWQYLIMTLVWEFLFTYDVGCGLHKSSLALQTMLLPAVQRVQLTFVVESWARWLWVWRR